MQGPIFSPEQVLLTTLVVKLAAMAALATMLVRYRRFRHILIFERRDWPDRLAFALGLTIPLTLGVISRLLLNYDAADLMLEGALLERLRPDVRHPAVAFVVRELSRSPRRTMAEVTAQVGFSARHLIQLFTAEVGLTPKLFARVRRFHDVVRHVHRRMHTLLSGAGSRSHSPVVPAANRMS